ncbi:MAG: sigma-70 family RNA polymerase sigma factor [Pseudomonadota bacterium]
MSQYSHQQPTDRGVSHIALWEEFAKERTDSHREVLFLRYYDWAMRVCRQTPLTLRGCMVDRDDLENGVCEELLKCIEKYDYQRGVPFEGFAFRRIRGAVLNQISGEVRHLKGRLSASQGVQPERSTALRDAVAEIEMLAVEVMLEEFNRSQTSAQEAELFQRTELVQLMRVAMESLTTRERDAVNSHFFVDKDKSEVARDLSISRGRVSQLIASALTKLRRYLMNSVVDDLTEW